MTFIVRASIELPARRAAGRLARLGLARLFRIVAALFAAANPPVRPQTFQNHLSSSGGGAGILAIFHAEPLDVLRQPLDFRKLLVSLWRGEQFRQFQLPAHFEPLNDRLETDFGKVFAEHAADGRSNQLARNSVRAFQLALVFELELAG